MRTFGRYLTLTALCILWACKSDEVDFTYLPASPRAGQSVAFSNLTQEGEEWLWDFGDGGESTLKSPSKTYRKPGTYVVTLTVDGKARRKCAKEIVVLDTLPTFTVNTGNISYRRPVTFTAVVYNPYNYNITCEWSLPACAVITGGDIRQSSLTAYFTEKDTDISIQLALGIGSRKDTVLRTFHIADTPAPSLLMLTEEQLLRQRLYDNGTEAPSVLEPEGATLTGGNTLLAHSDLLYILTNSIAGTGHIYAFDMGSRQLSTVITDSKENASGGFLAGMIAGDYLYWGSNGTLHRIPLSARDALFAAPSDYLFAAATQFDGMPEGHTTGVAACGSIRLWSTGKGICRFTGTDATATMLLTEYGIDALCADALARKIYFIAEGSLFVCNIDGTYVRQLADNATGAMAIDNGNNRIFFAQTGGVACLPLVQTQNNQTTARPVLLNGITGISALAADNTER